MQNNTVQTLIDYVKDLSGQTNASTAKIIRALNFGTDHLSLLKKLSSSRSDWDSRNHGDVSVVTTTTSEDKLELENELVSVKKLELLIDGKYRELNSIDQRDEDYEELRNKTGRPTDFDIAGNFIRPLPVPDGSYTYRLTYGRIHPRYSVNNLSQATGLEPTDEEYVALYAADRIMIGVSDSARSAVRNELTLKAEEVKKAESFKSQSTNRRMKPKLNSTFSNRE